MERTYFIILLLLVFLLSMVSCDKEPEVDLYGSIEGIITDAITHKPIDGALVTISPISTSMTTGSDGGYLFSSLEPSAFVVQVSNIGYETNSKTVTVEPGEPRKGDVQLYPNSPILSASVSSIDFGSNLTLISIEVINIGQGDLEWTIHEDVAWVSVDPLNGIVSNEIDYINVSIDRTGLETGPYHQAISINSVGGNISITITMHVNN